LAFHSGREADHSPPSRAEVGEWVELYLHSPNAPSWRGAQLGQLLTFLSEGLIQEACEVRVLYSVSIGTKSTRNFTSREHPIGPVQSP
jgi:hypothetical protein